MLKDSPPENMLETIRAVHNGDKRIQAEIATELALHSTEPTLTAREMQVLELLANGNSNREIAACLAIHAETAKGHVRNLLAKLGARDRTQAVDDGHQARVHTTLDNTTLTGSVCATCFEGYAARLFQTMMVHAAPVLDLS